MRDKNILIKFLLLFVTIIVLFFILVILFFTYRIGQVKKNTVENLDGYVSILEFDSNSFDGIDLNFINSYVNIQETNDKMFRLEQVSKYNNMYFKGKIKNRRLHIEETNVGAIISTYVTIYIPENYIDNMNITNAFGNVNIKDIIVPLYIKNNSGNIVLNGINKKLNIDNVSGNINIQNISSDLTVTTSTGNLVIDNMIGSVNVDSISGNVVINNLIIKNDSKIDSITGDISLIINNESECYFDIKNDSGINKVNQNKCLNGGYKLNVTNVTGNIEIK